MAIFHTTRKIKYYPEGNTERVIKYYGTGKSFSLTHPNNRWLEEIFNEPWFWGNHFLSHINKSLDDIKALFRVNTKKFHSTFLGNEKDIMDFVADIIGEDFLQIRQMCKESSGVFEWVVPLRKLPVNVSVKIFDRDLCSVEAKRIIFVFEPDRNPLGYRIYSIYPDNGNETPGERMKRRRKEMEYYKLYVK